jgi:hypothetical protein
MKMKKYSFGFAAAGSLLTILFLAIVNYLTSPGTLWFVYPAFGILWWPVAILFLSSGQIRAFSVTGCVMLLLFLGSINVLFSPGVPWVLCAFLPVLWWPVSVFFGHRAGSLGFALFSCLAALLYYGWLNLTFFPGHPWLIYIAYALLWWPMTLFFVRRHMMTAYAVAGALLTILFFIAVNMVTSPLVIWCVYPIFAVLWWPLALFFFSYRMKQQPHAAKN